MIGGVGLPHRYSWGIILLFFQRSPSRYDGVCNRFSPYRLRMIRGMRGITQRRAHGETRANEYYTEIGVRQGSFCGGTGLAGGRAHLNGTLPPPMHARHACKGGSVPSLVGQEVSPRCQSFKKVYSICRDGSSYTLRPLSGIWVEVMIACRCEFGLGLACRAG